MKCIVVDDEPLARDEMQSLIQEFSQMEVLGEFSNAVTALDFIKMNQVDLVFLDIEMPTVSGLEFAEQIPKNTLIIFTTAYPQFAIKSYELDAIDYLLKPIDEKRLEKAVKKAFFYKDLLSEETVKNTVEANNDEFLFIKADRRFYKINFSDIKFIEALKDYVVIYTTRQKLITAMNLKTIHQKIPANIFLRVSKSFVVNTNHVESFDNHSIYIEEVEISLGAVYKDEFFRKYSDGTLRSE